jgi:hypothetical protein
VSTKPRRLTVRTLAHLVTQACAEALATGDVVALHEARDVVTHFVLGPPRRGAGARLQQHDRLRESQPLSDLISLTFKALHHRA